MTVKFASHKIEHRVSDNDIVVISESSRKSLEEIGVVDKLSPHQSQGKGKEHDVELGQPDPEEMPSVSQLSAMEDDFDVLTRFGSDPQEWGLGKVPFTQLTAREVALLTRTPAHDVRHRKAKVAQIINAGLGIASIGTSGGLFYLVHYYLSFPSSVWAACLTGIGGAVSVALSVYLAGELLRNSGIMRRTESNLT
jgi:hypothetical protein